MQQLLVATQNSGKQKEFRELLAGVVDELLFPDDVNLADLDVVEDGETYHENAEKKARAFFERSGGVPSVAGDTGFEVMALDGAPGLHSKRWLDGSSEDRNLGILERLEQTDSPDRSCRFVTVLALVQRGEMETVFFEGEVRGEVATEPRGEDGFGYDPIFIPEGYEHTFAELGQKAKDELSHRANAIAELEQALT